MVCYCLAYLIKYAMSDYEYRGVGALVVNGYMNLKNASPVVIQFLAISEQIIDIKNRYIDNWKGILLECIENCFRIKCCSVR